MISAQPRRRDSGAWRKGKRERVGSLGARERELVVWEPLEIFDAWPPIYKFETLAGAPSF